MLKKLIILGVTKPKTKSASLLIEAVSAKCSTPITTVSGTPTIAPPIIRPKLLSPTNISEDVKSTLLLAYSVTTFNIESAQDLVDLTRRYQTLLHDKRALQLIHNKLMNGNKLKQNLDETLIARTKKADIAKL